MTKIILTLVFFISLIKLVEAQSSTSNKFDSLVANAISLSEKALFDSRLVEAQKIVQTSYFESYYDYDTIHKIIFTIQDIRIEGFMSILNLKNINSENNFNRLKELLPYIQKIDNGEVQGNYFLTYSSAQRSIGNIDSALVYEEKAMTAFLNIKELGKVAVIQANRISREHNQLLSAGQKEEILELIPKYEEEIRFSRIYSKYALAYNTRHLAQIHLRQTLNYKEALRLFNVSLALREEIGFKPFIPASYSSLGDVYLKMGEFEMAIEMYLKTSALAKEIDFVRYKSYPILAIGDIYLSQNNKKSAKEFYTKSLKLASMDNYTVGIDQAIEKINQIENEHNKK